MSFLRFSLNFARNKDSIWLCIHFSLPVFLFIIKKYKYFSTFPSQLVKSIPKIYKNDIPWRFLGIHHVTEWRTLAWVTIYPWFYCLNPPELKKWPAELRYKVTSRGNTNNADLFPSQGRNIWNKYFIPALYQSPAFEKGFTADNRQNSSARTDDARLILKKDSESA